MLLFDETVSPRLVAGLSDVFPRSVHLRDVGLARAADAVTWRYAMDYDLTIVSKDSDFHQVTIVRGTPPKVIWIRRGNCPTASIGRCCDPIEPRFLHSEPIRRQRSWRSRSQSRI